VRAFWTEGKVILAMELLAESLDPDQVAHAVSLMSLAADHWDSELEKAFGGETYFTEEPQPSEPAAPGTPATPPGADPPAAGRDLPKGEDPPAAGYI